MDLNSENNEFDNDFENVESQINNLEKGMSELTGEVVEKHSSETLELVEEEQALRNQEYYFALYPPKNIADLDVFYIFSQMKEVVPGQLIASVFNLKSNLTLLDKYKAGNNIAYTSDNKQFYAVKKGQLTWWDNILTVEEIKKMSGEITSNHGKIDHKGTLVIDGNIGEGAKIEVDGDIYVFENIGKSEVHSTGNIFVKNGIRSHGGGMIRSDKNIFAKFIENSNVEANHNVVVNDAIMHSKVNAGNKIVVNGKQKNLIVGGVLCAGSEISCGVLGSESYTTTELVVGLSGKEKKELDNLISQKVGEKNKVKNLDVKISKLVSIKADGTATEEQLKKLENLKNEKQNINNKIKELTKKTAIIEEQMDSRKDGKVTVKNLAYPGVKLTVNKAVAPINKTIKHVTITDKNAELDFSSYRPPIIVNQKNPDFVLRTPPISVKDAKLVRKSMLYVAPHEKIAIKKASELLRIKQDNLVWVVTGRTGRGKNEKLKLRIVEVKEGENKRKIKKKITPFDKNKALSVSGDTIEECLHKVSGLFKVSVDKLDYQIIQKAKEGVFGVGKKDYTLKVFLKKVEVKELKKNKIFKNITQDLDGYFTIQNTSSGLMLNVFPAKGNGKPVSTQDIAKDLKVFGYSTDINFEKINELVASANGIADKIAPRQPEPELDGKYELRVSEDKQKVYLTLYPPEEGGEEVKVEQVISDLEKQNIKKYDKKKIKEIFDDNIWAQEIKIATGTPAKNGEDAKIDFKVNINTDKNLNLKEDESGKVDFHEMGLIENVVTGQILARKIPATLGQNGEDVYGEIIKSEDGKDVQMVPGKNVSLSDDEMEMLSDIDGQVVWDGKKIKVEPIYHVNGDVSFETGNITFLGTVIITGTVRDDFVVRASGDIFVNSIAAAELEAEGNIIIKGGCSGRDKAVIKAGGSVMAKFIEQATVQAGRNVVISEAIMHSRISAGKVIICLDGKRGLLVGGLYRAGEEIYAREVGSKIATRTIMEVGIDPAVRQSISELESKLREQKLNFDKVRKGIKALTVLKKKNGSLPPQKESLLLELVGLNRVLNGKLQAIQQELKTLQAKMRETSKGKVSVSDTVYTGVRVIIKNAVLLIDEEFKFTTFYYDQGEVRFKPYEEPSTKLLERLKSEVKEPKIK